MKFKSKYAIDEAYIRETALHSIRCIFIGILILSAVFIPLSIIFEYWIPLTLCSIILVASVLVFIVQNKKVSEICRNTLGNRNNRKLNADVKFYDNKIVYNILLGSKNASQPIEYKYSNISRVWKSKNYFIILMDVNKKNSVVAVKRDSIDQKKFLSFLKEKRKKQ